PPEAAAEVGELGVLLPVQGGHFRLQGHAALGAVAGVILAHLRVHGAGVDGAGGRAVRGRSRGLEVGLRVGGEFVPAAGAAEVVGMAPVVVAVGGIGGHSHAAYRVAECCRRVPAGTTGVVAGGLVVGV